MVFIHKILFLLLITFLSGCFRAPDTIEAYGYSMADNKCVEIKNCPIEPVSKLIISANRNTYEVAFKDENINDKSQKIYGKLSECLVIDYANFKCNEMTVSNGNFNYAVFKYIKDTGEIAINKDNYFSKYFAISSSKSLYITSSIYPLITLGSQSGDYAHYINFVVLAIYILIPIVVIFWVYKIYLIFSFLLKDILNRVKKKIKIKLFLK